MRNPTDMADVDISVVIPAYNGGQTIGSCLDAVQQASGGRHVEVIVVNSSPDATSELIRRGFPDVTVIQSEARLSAGAARNMGVSRARGKLIFFLDQDCIVPKDWMGRLERHLRDSSVSGAGGSVGIRNLSNLSGCALYFLEFLNHFPCGRPAERDGNFLVACNCVFRADVVRVVPFPDQTLGEDILFSKELHTRGFQIIYDPSVAVLHHNREGWREFFEYNNKMGRASANYHKLIKLWWAAPVLRFPSLAFLAPIAVLPTIALDLLRSRPSYLFRFFLLSPMCLAGNLVWARGFWRQARANRRRRLG
jgi:GT2 family glycosyltransferase